MPRLAKVHELYGFLSKTCPFNSIWDFDRKLFFFGSLPIFMFLSARPAPLLFFATILLHGNRQKLTILHENLNLQVPAWQSTVGCTRNEKILTFYNLDFLQNVEYYLFPSTPTQCDELAEIGRPGDVTSWVIISPRRGRCLCTVLSRVQ